MDDTKRRAFVCGHPIAHSRSPLIHNYWLQSLGVSGSYERIDVSPSTFERFLRDLGPSGYVGGNVTLPHKQAAFQLADEVEESAQAIGAANTIWIEGGRIHAANTDAAGFTANLDDRAPNWRLSRTALVLGAGGAARAILYALKQAGITDIRIVNRTLARAETLAGAFQPVATAHEWVSLPLLLGESDLLINTTSVGMANRTRLDLDLGKLPPHAIVADIVYDPLETILLAEARRCGLTAVDGLGMLLHQAVPGFARWFGVVPEVTPELRRRIVADLERKP